MLNLLSVKIPNIQIYTILLHYIVLKFFLFKKMNLILKTIFRLFFKYYIFTYFINKINLIFTI